MNVFGFFYQQSRFISNRLINTLKDKKTIRNWYFLLHFLQWIAFVKKRLKANNCHLLRVFLHLILMAVIKRSSSSLEK